MRKDQVDKQVLCMLPPDPLHVNILGPPNDVLELLEENYPVEMTEEFYMRHNLTEKFKYNFQLYYFHQLIHKSNICVRSMK